MLLIIGLVIITVLFGAVIGILCGSSGGNYDDDMNYGYRNQNPYLNSSNRRLENNSSQEEHWDNFYARVDAEPSYVDPDDLYDDDPDEYEELYGDD